MLGASYRGGVKETAFSGVFAAVAALRERGAQPFVTDPMFSDAELEALGLPPYPAASRWTRRSCTPTTPRSAS